MAYTRRDLLTDHWSYDKLNFNLPILRILHPGNAVHILDTQCSFISDVVISRITSVLLVASAEMNGHKYIGIGYTELNEELI